MSIGNWIVVAFVLFTGFIATLVTVCMRQEVSLVSKDYYKDELAYQSRIEQLNNTAALEIKPVIKVLGDNLEITIGQSEKIENGQVKLFCPSNDKMDRDFQLKSTTETFSVSDLQRGIYRAKMSWEMKGRKFYFEEVIYI